MAAKIKSHLQVLRVQIESLEDQGHLEPGQAAAALRIIRRLERARMGNKSRVSQQARKRLDEAVTDLVKLFVDVNESSL